MLCVTSINVCISNRPNMLTEIKSKLYFMFCLYLLCLIFSNKGARWWVWWTETCSILLYNIMALFLTAYFVCVSIQSCSPLSNRCKGLSLRSRSVCRLFEMKSLFPKRIYTSYKLKMHLEITYTCFLIEILSHICFKIVDLILGKGKKRWIRCCSAFV